MNRPFHPILFALYPVLSLYSVNTALIPASDVVVPLLIVLASACCTWVLLSLILRSISRAAVGVSVGVVGFFAYGHVGDLLTANVGYFHRAFEDRQDMLPSWAVIWTGAVVLACWKWKRADGITRAMNVVGVALAVVPAFSISMAWISAWRGTAVVEASTSQSKLNVTTRPDIYYIILDGYGRSDAIKRVIGVDNSWFVKALENLGFYVEKNARSNYCETELSLSSSLNLEYLPTLFPKMNPTWDDREVLDKSIDQNDVSKYLKRLGYRYEALTTGFPSIHPYSADLWLRDSEGVSLFAGQLVAETPLPPEQFARTSQFESRRVMIRSAAENMARGAIGGSQPRFIFVHILAPHPPFVFTADGSSIQPKRMGFTYVDGSHYYQNGGTPEMYSTGYAGQVTYLSKIVLASIKQILKTSPKPPVIIIQGDHGSKLRLDQEFVGKTDLNECFPNLNAYYVPPKVRETLYDGITPVNSFRVLFNGLFDDHFPLLPDRSYFSGWSTPFKFIEVTNKINRVPSGPSPAKP